MDWNLFNIIFQIVENVYGIKRMGNITSAVTVFPESKGSGLKLMISVLIKYNPDYDFFSITII